MKKKETITYISKREMRSSKFAVLAFGLIYALVTVLCFTKPDSEYSISERRKLKQMPDFSRDALGSGDYIKDMEEYVVDQFPARDWFRSVKNYCSLGVM